MIGDQNPLVGFVNGEEEEGIMALLRMGVKDDAFTNWVCNFFGKVEEKKKALRRSGSGVGLRNTSTYPDAISISGMVT